MYQSNETSQSKEPIQSNEFIQSDNTSNQNNLSDLNSPRHHKTCLNFISKATFAQNAFGNDWIIKSFQLARQYCPNAILILNDYNVLSWYTDKFITLARPVIAAGVVDALGAQPHGLADRPLSETTSKLNQIAALGLPIYISEHDIEKTNDQEQLQVMKQQFPLFYNHASVKGITLWGHVVGRTWCLCRFKEFF